MPEFPWSTLTGAALVLNPTVNLKQEQHMLLLIHMFILHSVLFNFDQFSICFPFYLPHSPLSYSSFLSVRMSAPPNNAALMEIFNNACRNPLGAVDGLLLEMGIYERWSAEAKERAC